MFFSILKQIVISIIFIAVIHYLYDFFKTNLTVPKVKDLVNRPDEKYKEIYESLNQHSKKETPSDSKQSMKVELKQYLSELSHKEPVSYQFSSSSSF